MFCNSCGTENNGAGKFCKNCGKPLPVIAESIQPAAEPVAAPVAPAAEPVAVPVAPAAEPVAAPVAPAAEPVAAPVAPAAESVAAPVAPAVEPAAQPIAAPMGQPAVAPEVAPAQSVAPVTKKAKKGLPKGAIIGIAAGAGVLLLGALAAIYFFVIRKPTINLNDYLEFKVTGYDGYGSVSAKVDWDSIEDDFGDKLKVNKSAKKELGMFGSLLDMFDATDLLSDCVDVYCDVNGYVSNGDVVSYKWDIDEDYSRLVKCKLKSTDGEYTVEGLKAAEFFDPFADLTVSFSGDNGSGYVDYDYTGSVLDWWSFEYDYSYSLSNGDTVTFSLPSTDADYFVERYGKIPTEYSKTYTVSGLNAYVSSYADIEPYFGDFCDAAKNYIISEITADISDVVFNDMTFEGYAIVADPKDGGWYSYNNIIDVMYSAVITNAAESIIPQKVYFLAYAYNVKIGDGNLEYDFYDVAGYTYYDSYDSNWYSSDGLTDPFYLYENNVEWYSEYAVTTDDKMDRFSATKPISSISEFADVEDYINETALSLIKHELSYNNNYDGWTFDDWTVEGAYLFTPKDRANYLDYYTTYVTIYSANMTNLAGDTVNFFFPVEFEDIRMSETGDVFAFIDGPDTVGYSFINGGDGYTYSFHGCETIEDIYRDVVEDRTGEYNVEGSGIFFAENQGIDYPCEATVISDTQVLDAADTTGNIVVDLSQDATITLTGEIEGDDGLWFSVETEDGDTGYVKADSVQY